MLRCSLLYFLMMTASFLVGQVDTCDKVIQGIVFDIVTNEPLPFATVGIEESGHGVVTDEYGVFRLVGVCQDEMHLEARYLGYKNVVHHHDFHHGDPMIFMAPDETLLEGVVIETERVKAYKTAAIQNLEITKVELLSNSISDLTEMMSGVSILKTGSNISKPIVHGLHSNRVLVMNDGLRHGYQVWADEHAPEIDPSHINEIELVKGAATVKYGPEALGGVILYKSKKPTLDQALSGSVGTSYRTNGRAGSTQLNIEQGSHRFAWSGSGFGVIQGDQRAPDYHLSNTGKREYGASFNTLIHQPTYEVQVSGSYMSQELGILRGSIVGNLQDLQNAIERGTPSPTNEPTYNIQNPRQTTQHGLLKSHLSLFLGEHIFKLQYGLQQNIRKEFDVRRGDLNERPVINLQLRSQTFEGEWVQPAVGMLSGNTGVQIFSQNSQNVPGSNAINFVPDYDVFNVGAYSIQSLDFDDATLELGVRLDYQMLDVRDTIREVTVYDNEVDFTNATFNVGFQKKISETVDIFTNVGTAWRPPNVSELYSFGYYFSRIQFGLWRYELSPSIRTPLDQVFDQSDREVSSERSLKWLTGVNIEHDRLTAEFIFYVNRINDYIYLKPYGVTTNIAGTFPFFIYDQTNALFLGSDWDLRYQHTEDLSSELKVSYVHATELESDQPFIEIPPLNLNYTVELAQDRWTYGLKLEYMAKQWRAPRVIEPALFQNGGLELDYEEIFDFMAAPDAYFLVGAKVGYEQGSWHIEATVDNALNTSYRSYTDRLRYFADATGRNFTVTVGYKF